MPNPVNATLTVISQSGTDNIDVEFNPAEYTYTCKAKYSNKEKGQPVFVDFEYQPFDISLFYDTYESGKDVRAVYTDKIAALVKPTESGPTAKYQPECIFSWGGFSIKGIIERVEQKFTMFLSDGTPVRATVNISIIQKPSDKERETDTGKNKCRKLWVVKSGDRLDLIANRVYCDPNQWRLIAGANNIGNPLSFPTVDDIGTTLIIPDITKISNNP